MSLRGKKPLKNIVALTLAVLLTLGQVLPLLPVWTVQAQGAAEAEPELIITGTGLEQDVLIYPGDPDDPDDPGDWGKYTEIERFYSSNNNYEYHKIWKVKGYDLFELMGAQNLKTDQDYPVTFIAKDNARTTRTVSALKSLYYYPMFTVDSGELVAPMIGFYRAALYEPDDPGLPTPAEVIWQDRPLTAADRDNNAPRLYLGQAAGNVDDKNQSFFMRDLARIVVGEERPPEEPEDDFTDSPYKHITYDGPPYNIDTLTGATMTVEGPGVVSYRALSLRQIEETAAEGLYRGTYREKISGEVIENSFEGIKISYILDNFVNLRENAGKVIFKNYQRQTIAEYTLEEIRDESRMMIAAYGVNEVPFVYTNLDLGYRADKYNDGGCFKLVFHPAAGEAVPAFTNVAYIYVEEEQRPGYEHDKEPYNDPDLTRYIFTLSGSGLGKEVNYTTADLEAMTDLQIEKEYSLSNSEYFWYYKTYKGVPLWDLLLEAGLDPEIDESTPVQFVAADYYNIPPLTVGDIKHHDRWGYYEKDPADLGDGTFDGSGNEPLETGYPVLVAYGFNGYPYVKHSRDPGYNSGLGNDGGPLRIIFGKRDYEHTNGSQQVKYAFRVVVGDDLPYTAHTYAPYNQLADETLTVTVVDEDGDLFKEAHLTVGEIEAMIYGDDVPAKTADRIRGKGYYFTHLAGSDKISDLYEGVDLNYLLFEKIGLPGTVGTATFTSSEPGQEPLVVNLEDITRADYFNEVTGVRGLKPLLAFAKNGYPLVKAKGDPGYLGSGIVNRYGPLMALFGQTAADTPGRWLRTVNAITVEMSIDPYAHLREPYNRYAGDELSISGDGVRKAHTVTVGQLEFMQNYIITGDYCLAKSDTEKESATYRGIDIYEFLRREVGFTAAADTITFEAADGFSKTYNLEEIAKSDYLNEETGAGNLKVMLAFGKNETPLVPDKTSEGYDSTVGNSGGPLRLIIGQTEPGDLNRGKSVSNVVKIIVGATAGDSWKHEHGLYTQYLDLPVLRVTGSQVAQPRTFSLRQLQALDEHIIRDLYMGDTQVEGVILWNLIKDEVGLAEGVTIPSSIRVFSGPHYNQLQNTSQVMNGVLNSQGLTKEIILGYAINGYPLVPYSSSPGYVNNNEHGPLRLFVEENVSMWTKRVDCIVVGTGGYEEPRAEDIVTGPVVFTVSGDGVPGGSRGYTLEQLKALGQTTASYSYQSKGATVTDSCTGVLLADILADLGITDPAWEIKLVAGDGYEHESYTVTLQAVVADAYLVAYLVNGSPIDSAGETLHLYRNHDDGSTWLNRAKQICGVAVASTDLELPWITYRNDDGSGLPYASVRCITPDQKGGLWVGTNGGGAAYRDAAGNWTTYHKDNSPLPSNVVYGIAVDETDGVWFVGGSAQSGMGAVYKRGDNWTIYTSENSDLPADYALTLALDDDGGVWFGTAAGLAHKDRNNIWRTYDLSDGFPAASVTQIALDGQGGAWVGFHPEVIGGQAGYAYLDPSGQVTAHTVFAGEPCPWVRSFSFDPAGGLWVVRYGMVDYIAADGTKFVYTDQQLVPFLAEDEVIRAIEVDRDGNLWISLSPGGLLRRDAQGRFSRVTSWPNPTFSSVWYMLACPSGAFYTGGNGGVTVLPPPGPAGGNADLKSLHSSIGTLVPAFDPAITAYRVLLPAEFAGVPLIGATVADTGRATRVIRNPATLADQAQVTVTAEDGTIKRYTLSFMREIQLPEPGTADDPAPVVEEMSGISGLYLNLPPADIDKYAVTVEVPAGAKTPALMLNTVAAGGRRQAVLPALTLRCHLFLEGAWQEVRVDIPAGTTVTGPADWDGVIQLPTVKERPTVSVDGTVSVVLEMGLRQGELLFDQAVRLHIPGQAGKAVGVIRDGRFAEITCVLAEDTPACAAAQLPPRGEGKIEVGADLVLWTWHFTEFVTYTPTPAASKPAPRPGDTGDEAAPAATPLPRTEGTWGHPALRLMAALLLLCTGMRVYFDRWKTA